MSKLKTKELEDFIDEIEANLMRRGKRPKRTTEKSKRLKLYVVVGLSPYGKGQYYIDAHSKFEAREKFLEWYSNYGIVSVTLYDKEDN